ncbi:hypothetical protein D3C76_937470 [compost metagenome]
MARDQAAAHRGQHHEVHQQLGIRHAQQFQGTAIGAIARNTQVRVVPRYQADDQEDRADVEQAHTPDHRVGRLDDLRSRVFGFGSGDGDDFGAEEGEHHPEQGTDHGGDAIGHETFGGEVADATHFTELPDVQHGSGTHDQEADDRDHLDQGEPELELTVVLDVEEVDGDQQQGRGQHEHVDADVGEETMQDLARHIGFPGHEDDPVPPVQPADGETGPTADGAIGVGGERTGVWRGSRHFTQHAHDQYHQDAACQVGQHSGWAGAVNHAAGTDEQGAADNPGDRHHRQVARLQRGTELALVPAFRGGGCGCCVHQLCTPCFFLSKENCETPMAGGFTYISANARRMV